MAISTQQRLERLKIRVDELKYWRAREGVTVNCWTLDAECVEIDAAILNARAELIARLMDTPPKVAGHSRVVDVEKSLDSLSVP